MNNITIGHIKRKLPSSWDELSRDQLLFLSRMFIDKHTVADFKVHLVNRFLRIKRTLFHRIDPEDAYYVGETMNFLLEDVSLTRQLIPHVSSRWPVPFALYGPSDAMMNCTFGEFTKAQMKTEEYSRTKDEKALNELVAVLYREKKWFWFIRKRFTDTTDCRRKYRDRDMPARIRKAARLPIDEKYAIYLFVTGVMSKLPDKFPNVYSKKGESDGKTGGWASLIISLADGKTDDESLDKVFYSNLYNVFLGLEQKAIEYFKFMEKIKKDD